MRWASWVFFTGIPCWALEFGYPQVLAPPNSVVTLKLINNEHKPIYVGLSLNQTLDSTPLPKESTTEAASPIEGASPTDAALLPIHEISADALKPENEHAIIIILEGSSDMINTLAQASFQCLEHEVYDGVPGDAACLPLTPERLRARCIPRVEAMGGLKMLVLDYSKTYEQCTPDQIQEDLQFVQSRFEVKDWEIDQVQPVQAHSRETEDADHKQDLKARESWALNLTRIDEAWKMIEPRNFTAFKPIVGLVEMTHRKLREVMGEDRLNVKITVCPKVTANRQIQECLAWLLTKEVHVVVVPDTASMLRSHDAGFSALSNADKLLIRGINIDSLHQRSCRPNEILVVGLTPETETLPLTDNHCTVVGAPDLPHVREGPASWVAGQAALALNSNPYLNGSDLRMLLAASRSKPDSISAIDSVKMISILRPDDILMPLEPKNVSTWDDLRFKPRRMEAGEVHDIHFMRGPAKIPEKTTLVAYSITKNYRPKAIARVEVVNSDRLPDFEPSNFAFANTATAIFDRINMPAEKSALSSQETGAPKFMLGFLVIWCPVWWLH